MEASVYSLILFSSPTIQHLDGSPKPSLSPPTMPVSLVSWYFEFFLLVFFLFLIIYNNNYPNQAVFGETLARAA